MASAVERRVAVFDVDGTVADARWRLSILGDRPASASREAWARFFDLAAGDDLIPSGAALVHAYASDHDIVWLTGRSDRIRPLTIDWLRRHGLPDGDLRMRPNDDLRPAAEWKMEQLHEIASERTIAVVVDDDSRVVGSAREHRFPAVLFDEGLLAEICQEEAWRDLDPPSSRHADGDMSNIGRPIGQASQTEK